jgi:hypothetical protein
MPEQVLDTDGLITFSVDVKKVTSSDETSQFV